jgi:hypothetical protein
LDDGAEVLLKAGDGVIQNGTRHAWHNRSAEKCVIAVTLVGAEHKPQLKSIQAAGCAAGHHRFTLWHQLALVQDIASETKR